MGGERTLDSDGTALPVLPQPIQKESSDVPCCLAGRHSLQPQPDVVMAGLVPGHPALKEVRSAAAGAVSAGGASIGSSHC